MSDLEIEERSFIRSVRRSKLEVYLDALRIIANGEGLKTRIMYKTGVCYPVLNNVMTYLLDNGFITKVLILKRGKSKKREKYFYKVTDKGMELIQLYYKLCQLLFREEKKKE